MYVQVLTFHLSDADREAATRSCEHAILGLSEFDGYVSDTCLTRADHDLFGGMIAWVDWKSLEAFRHSELYAKLLLSPHFTDASDRAFSIGHGAPATMQHAELLAVA